MAGLMAEYIKRKNNYTMKKKKKNKADYNVKKDAYAKYLRALARGEDVPEVKNPDEEPEFVLKGGKWSKNNYAMKYKNNRTTQVQARPLEPQPTTVDTYKDIIKAKEPVQPGTFSEQQGEDVLIADAGTDPETTPGRLPFVGDDFVTTPGAPEETKPSSLSFEKKNSDGSVRMTYDYYLGENDEKIKHGKYSRNYGDGSLAAEGQFEDGQKVGVWKEYKDGKLVRTNEYAEEVDGRQKMINKVSYDEEGNPRDLEKEFADREWKNRRNFLNVDGASVDLAKLSDEELTKKISQGLPVGDPGYEALSHATVMWMEAIMDKYEAERQIRIDAGRWGGGALDEYIERVK